MRADSGCEPLHVADDTSRDARGARAARFLAVCLELFDKNGNSCATWTKSRANSSPTRKLMSNSSHTQLTLKSNSSQTHVKLVSEMVNGFRKNVMSYEF